MQALAPIAAEPQPRQAPRADFAFASPAEPSRSARAVRVEPAERGDRAGNERTPARPAIQARASSARLSYDQLDKQVYVEIVDPRTGDVLQRLPPETLAKRLGFDTQPGSLVDRSV